MANQGHRENSEASGQKRERGDPLHAENVQGLAISYGKLLLVYFMRPPDLEVLGVKRPLGP